MQHIIVPKTHNLPALCLQKNASLFVIHKLFLMLSSIKLNRYFLLNAREVGDVFPDGMLTAKTLTIKLLAS